MTCIHIQAILKRRGKLLVTATARQRDSKGQPLTAFTRLSVLAPR